MDSFTEKKWFVYVGDRHEGPFSIAEIQGKMSQGEVTTESFVWAEGMADWQAMKETPGFEKILSGGQHPLSVDESFEPNPLEASPVQSTQKEGDPFANPSPYATQSKNSPFRLSEEKTGDLSPADLRQARNVGNEAESESIEAPRAKRGSLLPSLKRLIPLLLLGGVGYGYLEGYLDPIFKNPVFSTAINSGIDAARPYLIELSDRAPFLERWISPIPQLEDVNATEMEELKKTARAKVSSGGPKVAIAMSEKDLLFPTFYLTSNVPDGAKFQVRIIGVPQTLLNQMAFETKVNLTVEKKLAQSQPIKTPDGKTIPRGEYTVVVLSGENQPPQLKALFGSVQPPATPPPAHLPADFPKDARILLFKTYFLGGQRDATYASRLKDYHEKLRTKANLELGDLKQFAVTLETQLASTYGKFAQFSKTGPVKQRRAWEAFHNDWSKLQNQLHDIFQKWNPETLQNDFFYPTLFALVQTTSQSVERIHSFQHHYFSGGSDLKSIQIQLGEAGSSAQSAISLLKSKIDQAEKIPPTQNGMPQREGL